MDGSTTATNLVVTQENGDDFPDPLSGYGGSRTGSYALDVDFFAYKVGAEALLDDDPKNPRLVRSSGTQAKSSHLDRRRRLTERNSFSGPWANVLGAGSSPATVTISDPTSFYRIKKVAAQSP